MNAPLLTEEFNLLAAAPKGVQKLRELILTLAMRGKLVAQDTKDEVKITTLGAMGKWAVGSGFPTIEQGHAGLEILFAKVSDMNLPENLKQIVTTNHTITRETAKRLKINIHPAGTVVFPKIGGAIATNKRRILTRESAIDNNCLGIIPKPEVSTDWLYSLLCSIDLTEYQVGTSVPALAQGVLQDILVRLPPLAEQQRIVAKVDELMQLCDQLEAQQTTQTEAHERLVATLLDNLTQSANAAAFADNWSSIAEHFDQLFDTPESIDKLKQSVLQLATSGVLLRRSEQLPCSEGTLADVVVRSEAGWSPQCEGRKREGDEWGVLKVSAVSWDDFDPAQNKALPRHLSARPDLEVRKGDFLISRANTAELVAKSVVVKDTPPRLMLSDKTIRLHFNDHADPRFFCLVNNAPNAREYYAQIAGGTSSSMKNVSRQQILRLPTLIPSLVEQHRIVAKVDELMVVCDDLAARLTASRELSLKLVAAAAEAATA